MTEYGSVILISLGILKRHLHVLNDISIHNTHTHSDRNNEHVFYSILDIHSYSFKKNLLYFHRIKKRLCFEKWAI